MFFFSTFLLRIIYKIIDIVKLKLLYNVIQSAILKPSSAPTKDSFSAAGKNNPEINKKTSIITKFIIILKNIFKKVFPGSGMIIICQK